MPCNRWWPVLCVTALVACSATPTKESAAPVSQPTAPAETTTAVVASEAEQAFRSAITKPLAAQKKGRCEKALRAWQNLQREYPSQALIPFNMALCHRQLGDSQAAGDALQQALALQPDSAVIMVEYALWLALPTVFTVCAR